MDKQEVKWLKWSGDNVEEWGKIECPMFNGQAVMTYYVKNMPCFYSYTAPFIDSDGDVCYYRFDLDEDSWDEYVFVLCNNGEYQENTLLQVGIFL